MNISACICIAINKKENRKFILLDQSKAVMLMISYEKIVFVWVGVVFGFFFSGICPGGGRKEKGGFT